MRGHVVVLRRVWGRHLIHLICLRCNRANASEAKFCSECGAGLLRKFCSRCRAINDAESHFCQSCGEALPAQPSVPHAAPMAPPAIVPDLTDVYAEPEEPSPAIASPAAVSHWPEEPAADSRWRDEPAPDSPWRDEPVASSHWPGEPAAGVPAVITEPLHAEPVAARPSHRTVLFGFVGGAALLLAALLWSQSEHPGMSSSEAPALIAPPVATPASAATVVAVPALVQPTPSTAPDNVRPGVAASAIVAAPALTKDPGKAQERRLAPEAQIAAQPPAAGPAQRSAPVERRPTVRNAQPQTPPPDCTPQVDALGLCAPGAKVADRSGSR